MEFFLTPHSWPLVNEDLLAKQDPVRRMQVAQGKWLALTGDPVLGPMLNPVEVVKAMIEEYGE